MFFWLALCVTSSAFAHFSDSSEALFRASDVAGKRQILGLILRNDAQVPIDEAIAVLRLALADPSNDVRITAFSVIAGRASVAYAVSHPELSRSLGLPDAWRPEDKTALQMLRPEVVRALTHEDGRVRHAALLAVGNLDLPEKPGEPYPRDRLAVMVEVFDRDTAPEMRSEIVKAFVLIPNEDALSWTC